MTEYERLLRECKTDTAHCLIWTGAKTDRGYGRVTRNYKTYRVHRLALELTVGKAPSGKPYALHSCHTPACFNPKHLRWGDAKDNSEDQKAAGRGVAGMANGAAAISESQAWYVLRMVRAGVSQRILADQLGVSKSLISKLATGRTWRHLHEV